MGINKQYFIGELSALTGVKAGTIRFYEKCGFLEEVGRAPNHYRVFNEHHLYQIRICRLVFGGFVNKHLRKLSRDVLAAAQRWDLEAYGEATQCYRQAIADDIVRTKRAAGLALSQMKHICGISSTPVENGMAEEMRYSKKQAAALLGVSPESIRNWERNGLLPQAEPYQKRFYGQADLDRMYVIRFLLDTGYSIMAILRFLKEYGNGQEQRAGALLLCPEEEEELKYRADRYLETLQTAERKSQALCALLEEMKEI